MAALPKRQTLPCWIWQKAVYPWLSYLPVVALPLAHELSARLLPAACCLPALASAAAPTPNFKGDGAPSTSLAHGCLSANGPLVFFLCVFTRGAKPVVSLQELISRATLSCYCDSEAALHLFFSQPPFLEKLSSSTEDQRIRIKLSLRETGN